MDVEGVLESDDVGRIGNLTAEFGEDGDGDFEDAGGGNVGLAFDFSGEGWRGILSAGDNGKGSKDESEGKAEHVKWERLERRRRGFQAKAGVPAN